MLRYAQHDGLRLLATISMPLHSVTPFHPAASAPFGKARPASRPSPCGHSAHRWVGSDVDSSAISFGPQSLRGAKGNGLHNTENIAFPCSLERPWRARKGVLTVRRRTPPAASEGPGKPPDTGRLCAVAGGLRPRPQRLRLHGRERPPRRIHMQACQET